MNWQFQYREFILLLALIPLAVLFFIYLLQWKKRTRKKMGDARLVKLLAGNFSAGLFAFKFILLLAAMALGVVAVMNPRKPGSADNITRKGIDVLVALDVSKSMLADDLAPSRLERARQFIYKLSDAMPDDRIGLVLFAGKAYLQMPLTSDHGALRLFVSSASPDAVPQQGTVISDALNMGVKAFNPKEGRFKSIVLISDGEDHDVEAVKTAGQLALQGVMINTIGAGTPAGSFIMEPSTSQHKVDASGNKVISRLNEETLKQVAASTNGAYFRLEGSDETVAELKKQLAQIESKAYGDVSLLNYKTFYMWFAGGMLLLLLIEPLVPETKKQAA